MHHEGGGGGGTSGGGISPGPSAGDAERLEKENGSYLELLLTQEEEVPRPRGRGWGGGGVCWPEGDGGGMTHRVTLSVHMVPSWCNITMRNFPIHRRDKTLGGGELRLDKA